MDVTASRVTSSPKLADTSAEASQAQPTPPRVYSFSFQVKYDAQFLPTATYQASTPAELVQIVKAKFGVQDKCVLIVRGVACDENCRDLAPFMNKENWSFSSKRNCYSFEQNPIFLKKLL